MSRSTEIWFCADRPGYTIEGVDLGTANLLLLCRAAEAHFEAAIGPGAKVKSR